MISPINSDFRNSLHACPFSLSRLVYLGPFMAAREPDRLVNLPPPRRGRMGICAGQRGIRVQSGSDPAAHAPSSLQRFRFCSKQDARC